MTSTPLDVAKELRPALTRLYLLYIRQSEDSHISMAQLSIMMLLDDRGPLRISQIAASEAVRMPTASNAIGQLENLGLVERIRDVSDRRGVLVDLTDHGRKELRDLGEERSIQLAEMLEGLEPNELEEVAKVVPMISMILDRYTAYSESKAAAKQ